MANRYFVGGGTGDWNSTTNWSDSDGGASGLSVPGSADDVFLTATSGANTLTVNVASAAKSITCTGFTGSLVLGANLTMSGNFVLVSAMTFTPSTYAVIFSGVSASITTGGKAFGALTLTPSGAETWTFVDDATVNSTLTINGSNGSDTTFTGSTIYAKGDVTFGSSIQNNVGTTKLVLNGSGNQTFTGHTNQLIKLDVEIASTGGTVTIAGDIKFCGGKTWTYTSGTVSAGTSTFYLWGNGGSTATIDSDGMSFYNLYVKGYNSFTCTLLSDLTATGTTTFKGNAGGDAAFNGAYNVHLQGNITSETVLNITGTATMLVDGGQNQTWTGNDTTNIYKINTTINKSGNTLSLVGTIAYSTGTLTYTAGTVNAGTSVLKASGSCNLNLGTMSLYDVQISTAGTTATLTGNMNVSHTLTINASTTLALGSNTLTVQGDVVATGSLSASSGTVIVDGTSTFSGDITFNDLTITAGSTLHLTSSNTYVVGGTFTAIGTPTSGITMDATTPDTQAVLTINGSQSVERVTATDIDSSAGKTVWDFSGTLDNATNWRDFSYEDAQNIIGVVT